MENIEDSSKTSLLEKLCEAAWEGYSETAWEAYKEFMISRNPEFGDKDLTKEKKQFMHGIKTNITLIDG